MQTLHCVRDIYSDAFRLESSYIKKAKVEHVDLANGNAEVSVLIQEPLYYEILSEMTGTEIKSEYQLISIVREMARLKKDYENVSSQ